MALWQLNKEEGLLKLEVFLKSLILAQRERWRRA